MTYIMSFILLGFITFCYLYIVIVVFLLTRQVIWTALDPLEGSFQRKLEQTFTIANYANTLSILPKLPCLTLLVSVSKIVLNSVAALLVVLTTAFF
jgi:hypothetical protein